MLVSGCSRNWIIAPHAINGNSNSHRASEKKQFKSISSKKLGVLLQSCIDSKSLEQGKRLHTVIREVGFERNKDLLPKLIKLYSVCGQINVARELFDRMSKINIDVHFWTSMITGYVNNQRCSESFDLFVEMMELGLNPDSYTFSALLKAAGKLGSIRLVCQLHSLIVKCGSGCYLSVENSLLHAYGSSGHVYEAYMVFERMQLRDVVSWSSLVQSFCSAGKYAEAMELFSRMQFEQNVKPNELTIVSVLPACGFFSSLRKGEAVHAYVIRSGFDSNIIVSSSLVTMYSQCGVPDVSYEIFCKMDTKNVILWTSMIEGFAMNGRFRPVMDLFNIMQNQGVIPNYVTLVVILSACSHAGFVNEGIHIFETMWERFGVKAGVEHYACVVDMLGRAGRLNDAEKFIRSMGIKPNGAIYGSLLGACQVHRNLEIAERVASEIFKLEPHNATNYVILSNIYALAGLWDDVGKVRQIMVAKGLFKDVGLSWIELKDKVYVFGAHDRSHIESDRIYKLLEDLTDKIVKAGYVPSINYVLLDVEDDEKKKLLCTHSERLAIAFGLLKAPLNVPIRVAKNLRVCGDCHDAIKLISKITARQLIVRDTNRFHHFSHGSCSCGDYW